LPHALVLRLFALPVGFVLAFGLLLGWSWTPSHELSYSVHGFADVAYVLLAVISFLVIHEVRHCGLLVDVVLIPKPSETAPTED
jgi:hypothetical protein